MTSKEELQLKSIQQMKIEDLLMYFTGFREMTLRYVAEKIGYKENYLSGVRNGSKEGGDRLVMALENFFRLDNLNQIQYKQRQKQELDREIAVLETATIESFYAERRVAPAGIQALHPASVNEPAATLTPGMKRSLKELRARANYSRPPKRKISAEEIVETEVARIRAKRDGGGKK